MNRRDLLDHQLREQEEILRGGVMFRLLAVILFSVVFVSCGAVGGFLFWSLAAIAVLFALAAAIDMRDLIRAADETHQRRLELSADRGRDAAEPEPLRSRSPAHHSRKA